MSTAKSVYAAVRIRSGGLCENIKPVWIGGWYEMRRCCAPGTEQHHYPPRARHSRKRYSYSEMEVFMLCNDCHVKAPRLRLVDRRVELILSRHEWA